jgi:uncharacterized membrane protein
MPTALTSSRLPLAAKDVRIVQSAAHDPSAGSIMDDIILARALHVLAVVIWIGGVAIATTVVLPAVRCGDLGEDRLQAFQAIEHRFVWQARTAVIVVGLTGHYMT